VSLEIVDLDDEVIACIRSHLKPEDVTENLLSLVQVAVTAHENAFHFSRNVTSRRFMMFIEASFDEARTSGVTTSQGEVSIANHLLSNLMSAHNAVTYHSANFPLITKESFLKFVGKAWDTGENQRKIYDFEIEGSVNNEFGVALNFACDIALFGERNGLMPAEYKNPQTPVG
jgi:hypothetical protein